MHSYKRTEIVQFDLSTLGKRLGEVETALDGRFAVVVKAETQAQTRALRDFMRALAGERDSRSTLRASIDAWKLRYFATVLGLAQRRGYVCRIDEQADSTAIVLAPSG